MARSHKKHLTSKSVSKTMKNYANRRIRQMSVYEDLPNHKHFRRITSPYKISDDYFFGWTEDICADTEMIYTLNRSINIDYNSDIWFRKFRNK